MWNKLLNYAECRQEIAPDLPSRPQTLIQLILTLGYEFNLLYCDTKHFIHINIMIVATIYLLVQN